MVTIQSQNFGVEIEMTGVSRGTAASVIANYFGVGGIHFAGGTYQTYEAKDSKGRVWKCMRDGSITPRRRRGGAIVEADDTYRCEVVTPILQYEDITDLQEVIRALVKKGAMANSSCGIHVHVDGANHTPESLCRLLNFATGRQDLFYEALQIGSRADHWCHKINPALFREMKKNGRASRNDAERIWYSVVNDGYDGGVDSSHYNSTRYHGINLHAFFTKGTVEFRLFNGTTHAGRIKAYVQFCLAMSAAFPNGLGPGFRGAAIGIWGHNDFGVLIFQFVNPVCNAVKAGLANTELLMQRNGGTQAHDLADSLLSVIHLGLKRLFHGSAPPETIQTRREPQPDQLRASAWVFTDTSSLLPTTALPVS